MEFMMNWARDNFFFLILEISCGFASNRVKKVREKKIILFEACPASKKIFTKSAIITNASGSICS